MSYIKSIKQKSSRLLLVCCLLLNMFVVAHSIVPRPAHAVLPCPTVYGYYICVDSGAALNRIIDIFAWSSFFNTATTAILTNAALYVVEAAVWEPLFEDLKFVTFDLGLTRVAEGLKLQSKALINTTDAAVDSDAKAVLLETDLKLAENAARQTGPSVDYLCNIMTTNQAVPLLQRFKDGFAQHLTAGYNSVYRVPGSDGDGPQYTADARRLRYGEYGSTKKGVPYCNPVDGNKACKAKNETFYDAALMSGTLDLERVYSVPKLIDHGDTTEYVPSEDESEQMWMTARQYCYNAMGPRPSVPTGENLNSPEGMRQRTIYDHCLSRQNELAGACFERLAWISRPNCEDSHSSYYCEAGRAACNAAKSAGVTLPPTYDCEKGLSYYQANQLTVMTCKAKERALQEAASGASVAESMESQDLCSKREAYWHRRVQRLDRVFSRAILGTASMDACWAELK